VKNSSYREDEDIAGCSGCCIATFGDYGPVECKTIYQENINTVI